MMILQNYCLRRVIIRTFFLSSANNKQRVISARITSGGARNYSSACTFSNKRRRSSFANSYFVSSSFTSNYSSFRLISSSSSTRSGSNVDDKAQINKEFAADNSNFDEVIPEPPPVIPAEQLQGLVQDNLHELGDIGSYYTPVGWIQNLLGCLHSYTGLPWWEVIILGTLIVRSLTLPIIISSQRQSAAMLEHKPELERLVRAVQEAQKSGDRLKHRMAAMEMNDFIRQKHFPVMKRALLPIFANGLIFASYFLSLRGMTSKPVVSMREEGFLWFTDLTLPDPTLLLPTMCAISLMLVIEMGVEFGSSAKDVQPGIRWLLRIAPLTVLLFGSYMPSAVMCYWFTSNIISLIVALVLRMASVRRVLKLPALPPKEKARLLESWRLPQFVRDYLSSPVLLVRAASAKFRKSKSNKPGDSKKSSQQR